MHWLSSSEALHFDFTSTFQVICQAEFSLKRHSPGESQIIETDECCPTNDVSLLKNYNLDFLLMF